MRDVAVIGVGETEFGELWDRSFRDIGIEAGLKAIQDAKIRSEDIDAVYIGNMSAGKFIDQEHVSALVADYAGLADMHLPTVRVEGGGACGAIALLRVALPDPASNNDRPLVPQAVASAYKALYANRERGRLDMPADATAVTTDGVAQTIVIGTANRLVVRQGLSSADQKVLPHQFGAPSRLVLAPGGERLRRR